MEKIKNSEKAENTEAEINDNEMKLFVNNYFG